MGQVGLEPWNTDELLKEEQLRVSHRLRDLGLPYMTFMPNAGPHNPPTSAEKEYGLQCAIDAYCATISGDPLQEDVSFIESLINAPLSDLSKVAMHEIKDRIVPSTYEEHAICRLLSIWLSGDNLNWSATKSTADFANSRPKVQQAMRGLRRANEYIDSIVYPSLHVNGIQPAWQDCLAQAGVTLRGKLDFAEQSLDDLGIMLKYQSGAGD